jgi:hypothetical protein
MTGAPSIVAELLAECEAHDLRIFATDAGGLAVDAPEGSLNTNLLAQLKAYKAELLAKLRLEPKATNQESDPNRCAQELQKDITPLCRCGGTTWRDVPIHNRQSIRRDCGRCGRFITFTVWYGRDTLQFEKHALESLDGHKAT